MASIRKRSPWRVVVDKDAAKAAVFATLKQAVVAAQALVGQGLIAGLVQEPKKGQPAQAGMALVERLPGGREVRIRSKSAPDLVKSFARKSDADDWAARREGEISKRQFVDYREADKNTLGDLLARFARDRLQGRHKHDPDVVRIVKLRDHAISRIRMSILQSSDVVTYRDERVNVVKGATVKKDLELLSRAIAIARAEWAIHMAANPASGRLVKRPEPQDGEVRDRRLVDTHVAVKAIAQLAAYPADGRTPPTRPGPKSRRTRPEEDYESGPDTAALLAMPQSDQQALLRACRYPSWYTRRKRGVTLAATQIPPPMATSDSPTLTVLR